MRTRSALPMFSTVMLQPAALPSARVEGLYVHIPFCFHKCHYCDFYSITRQNAQRMANFVNLVLRESDLWSANAQGPALKPRTVFFGGGTPTLLPLEEMRRLIKGLRSRYDLGHCDEWTIEANPATVTDEYCGMLREEGIDRLSFGAQSFDPKELAILERHHDPADVPRSIDIARRAGFARLNVDLIYGIPGQTRERWLDSLRQAMELGTPHVSCYGLTYEPNTPIAVKKRLGQLRPIDEEVELGMFHETRQILATSGRPAYEISNYAMPGEECRHNLMYWSGGNYIGLGPAAASHVEGWRWRNKPHLGEWETSIESATLPAIEIETLTTRHRAGELAMLSLRLTRGLVIAEFQKKTGFDPFELFRDPIEQLSKPGLIDLSDNRIRLTEKGLNVADSVAGEFLKAVV